MNDGGSDTEGTIVVVSFSPTDGTTEAAVTRRSYVRYLQRVHEGSVIEGDEWSEFVNEGCGRTRDVSFRVETVTGASRIDDGTTLVLEARED